MFKMQKNKYNCLCQSPASGEEEKVCITSLPTDGVGCFYKVGDTR